MKAPSVIAASVLLLSGCALQEKGEWLKPGITETQWKRDNYECTRDATYYVEWATYYPYRWSGYPWRRPRHYFSMSPRLDPYLYEMCLEAKGYTWKPEE